MTATAAVLAAMIATPLSAQTRPRFMAMGDSIGQGVQSADANEITQPFSFVNLIGLQMGAPVPLPLIRTSLTAAVGSVDGRRRVDPNVRSYNLAVSGATVHSVLYDAATAADVSQIDRETELVLFPQTGSQIDIVEQLRPEYVAVWIGNNDALGAALAFSQLNATQLTPVADFTADFEQLASRLQAAGSKVVFGTIPDITGIGALLTRQEVAQLLGSDHGMAEGTLTGLPTALLVKLGLENGTIFSNPDYVLDPAEQKIISDHIDRLNDVIRRTAAAHGMAVADMHGVFDFLTNNPLNLFGVPLTTRFLGGLFSLDGVHPSNIGQAIAAMFFIDAFNQHYGAGIRPFDGPILQWLVATDPFIDKDGDRRVTGRFGGGLLETVMSVLGISGDTNDAAFAATTTTTSGAALDAYAQYTGTDLRQMSSSQRTTAFSDMFGAVSNGDALRKLAVFTPSPDHAALVQSYVFDIFAASADPKVAAPIASRNLGKPAIVSGEIAVDVSSTMAALPPGTYRATVASVGSGGTWRSSAVTFTH